MWQHDHGMLRPSSANRGDIVTDCMIELLAEGGSPAVTLRSLADRIGVTPSGVLRWFGSTDLMWEVIWTRVWLALVEVGRHRPRVRAVVDQVETEERALIKTLLGRDGDSIEADAIVALVRGLRHAICAPQTPIPVRRAHVVLARHLIG